MFTPAELRLMNRCAVAALPYALEMVGRKAGPMLAWQIAEDMVKLRPEVLERLDAKASALDEDAEAAAVDDLIPHVGHDWDREYGDPVYGVSRCQWCNVVATPARMAQPCPKRLEASDDVR